MKVIEKTYWQVECICGNMSDNYFNIIYIRENLVKDGWIIIDNVAICPACYAKIRKTEKVEEKI